MIAENAPGGAANESTGPILAVALTTSMTATSLELPPDRHGPTDGRDSSFTSLADSSHWPIVRSRRMTAARLGRALPVAGHYQPFSANARKQPLDAALDPERTDDAHNRTTALKNGH